MILIILPFSTIILSAILPPLTVMWFLGRLTRAYCVHLKVAAMEEIFGSLQGVPLPINPIGQSTYHTGVNSGDL